VNREVAQRVFAPAARAALTHFDLSVDDIEFVSIAENVTFRVTNRRDGEAYVLRLHRPAYHTLDELMSERVWIRALRSAGVRVPVPVTATDGREYVTVDVAGTGESRHAGISHWIDGDLLAGVLRRTDDLTVLAEHFAQLGALMATMHNQASTWPVPATFKRHSFDAEGLMGEAPFWGPFWEHPVLSKTERALLLDTRDRVRGALVRYGRDRSTFSLIHADLHPGNVVVNGDQVGVIDFDDAGFGWHQYDIAVALASYQSKSEFPAIEAALLRGYRTVREITPAAIALIPMFLLIRGMATIGWIHGRPEIDRSEFVVDLKDAVCAKCRTFVIPC